MNRLSLFAAAICFLVFSAMAQDPLKVLPNNYKLEFENEWVKVVRVHYGAKEKIPAHNHTESAAAYVYLSDSGPVIFKHINASYGAVTRAAVKAGSFRLYRSVREIHEVENPNDTASEFLRIEFKTEPINEKELHGKYHREEVPAGDNFTKVQFENEQIRVTRLICAPGRKMEMTTTATEPGLLIALTTANIRATGAIKKPTTVRWEVGKAGWLATGQKQQFENIGDSPAELLRFDFKTKPVKPNPNEKEKSHAHPHD